MSAFIRFAKSDGSLQFDFSKIEAVWFLPGGPAGAQFSSGKVLSFTTGYEAEEFKRRWEEYATDCQQRERMAAFNQ